MTSRFRAPLRNALLWMVQRAAGRYVAGTRVQDALRVQTELRRRGWHSTLGYWDTAAESAAEVIARYRAALRAISESDDPGYLSIKGWAFDFDAPRYRELHALSERLAIPLHFDAGAPSSADASFDLLTSSAREGHTPPGFTLPARWARSLDDAEHAGALGLPVRVVKGQWPDEEGQPQVDINRNYLAIVERLARCGSSCVRVATHDVRLAEAALRHLKAVGSACELELLYGLPSRQLLPLALSLDVPVRFYIPYGHGYLPYGLSAIRRNPRTAWWLARDALLRR